MPVATSAGNPTQRFELKSLPGGYIVLRRLDFGQKMFRKSLLAKPKLETSSKSRRQSGFVAELEFLNDKITQYEFATCIIEHNLTYLVNPTDGIASEARLDFTIPDHVKMLDGRVGEEIDDLITDFNNFDGDEEAGK
jgi:hypothetical protein